MNIVARSGERRLLALALAGSIALHAAALALGPRWQREFRVAVPPLIVEILAVPTSIAPPAEPERAPASPPAPAANRAVRLPERAPASPPVPAANRAAQLPERDSVDAVPRREQATAAAAELLVDRGDEAVPVPSGQQTAASQEHRPEASGNSTPGAADATPRLVAAYLRTPPPRYPASARRKGEEGTVVLKVLVTPDGAASRVGLEKSSGSAALDEAAREAVKGWVFAPARRGAEPVETWVLVPVVFRLDSRG